MMDKQNERTQADRLADALQVINKNVTAADRKEANEKFGHTLQTISKYLNGTVQDNDTAAKLLEFFKGRIAKRDKILN